MFQLPKSSAFVGTALVLASSFLIGCKDGSKEAKDEKFLHVDSTTSAKVSTGQKPGDTIAIDPNKKYIFLAFDDGPQPPGSINCFDVFKDQKVKATFFLVGMHQFDPLRKRIVDSIKQGYPEFLVANHSYSHGFRDNYKKFYSNPDSAVADFQKANEIYNFPTKIVRFPGMNTWAFPSGEIYGPKSSRRVAELMDSVGYTIIGWDAEWRFGRGSTPIQGAEQMAGEVNKLFENGLTREQNTVVLLAHDRMFAKPQYRDSLVKFITILKQNPAYIFETLDHYPAVMGKK